MKTVDNGYKQRALSPKYREEMFAGEHKEEELL